MGAIYWRNRGLSTYSHVARRRTGSKMRVHGASRGGEGCSCKRKNSGVNNIPALILSKTGMFFRHSDLQYRCECPKVLFKGNCITSGEGTSGTESVARVMFMALPSPTGRYYWGSYGSEYSSDSVVSRRWNRRLRESPVSLYEMYS